MQLKTSLVATISAVFLTACGGGGGGEPAPITSVTKAEGYYAGTFSSSANPNGIFEAVVLENDEVLALYGTRRSTGETVINGMIQGRGASNNGSFSVTDLRDFYSSGQVVLGTLSASYVAGVSLKGNASSGTQTAAFTATSPISANYNYNAAPKLADIVGSWTGLNLSGNSSTVTIKSDGTLSSVDAGCATTGTVIPRASGKNVFNLSIVVASTTACGKSAGLTGTGYVFTNLRNDRSRQITALYFNPERDRGSAFIAFR